MNRLEEALRIVIAVLITVLVISALVWFDGWLRLPPPGEVFLVGAGSFWLPIFLTQWVTKMKFEKAMGITLLVDLVAFILLIYLRDEGHLKFIGIFPHWQMVP